MKVLVLGARGMLGHMVCRVLGEDHEVWGTTRSAVSLDDPLGRFIDPGRWMPGVDAHDLATVETALDRVRPDSVINCIGIVKQAPTAEDPVESITINSLFPHLLASACREHSARLIHFSTDCVFSGERGMYSEADIPDPVDLYGRSKLLGETPPGEALTLRTSVVGRELQDHWSFFEWILANRGRSVRGFEKAIYSGLTTRALSRIIGEILEDHLELTGTWQVASPPVSKYWLIKELNDRLGLGMKVDRDEEFSADRSLDGSAFVAETGIEVPSWAEMLDEFATDQPSYEGIGP